MKKDLQPATHDAGPQPFRAQPYLFPLLLTTLVLAWGSPVMAEPDRPAGGEVKAEKDRVDRKSAV